ncbi:MAG: hypothetical protein Q8L14_38070 [Myxococcales bacterium]|nr:hypothetical protein [Myxococcales bacterium]
MAARIGAPVDDALRFIDETKESFDVVIIDFPDPNNFSLGKLYTTKFYSMVKRHIAEGGVAVIQSTSPLFARKSFWCIDETVRAAGFATRPKHVWVPSFGEWGDVMASTSSMEPKRPLPEGLSFLSEKSMPALFSFPPDMDQVPSEVNRLNNQVLVHTYEDEWRRWN